MDPTHVFTLSQVYEGLLLKMGEKGNDGGQFFTPREVIRAMVRVVDPKIGETVYDPGCGTGGFLAQSYEYMQRQARATIATADQLETLKQRTFYGREKENLIYPIALANLVLHGIDEPHLWHGNTLTGQETYGGLFQGAPQLFDVVLTNPPFGGKEGKEAQTQLRLQDRRDPGAVPPARDRQPASDGGRCGIVLDEGVLFRTNEDGLRPDQAQAAGRLRPVVHREPARRRVHGRRRRREDEPAVLHQGQAHREDLVLRPLRHQGRQEDAAYVEQFEDFFRLLPTRGDSERSWTVTREQIEARNYDLKAVNPNAKVKEDTRTPEEILDLIEKKGQEIQQAIAQLRAISPEVVSVRRK